MSHKKQEFTVETWQPYYVEGLPFGGNKIKLTLVDKDGKVVQTPLHPVQRVFTLLEDHTKWESDFVKVYLLIAARLSSIIIFFTEVAGLPTGSHVILQGKPVSPYIFQIMPGTFSNKQIEEYYDLKEVHYRRGWKLQQNLSLHYGYWDDTVKSFSDSLARMNEKMAEFGNIQTHEHILDAGCGVGGSSIFLAKTYGCRVTGITLSARQVATATKNAEENGIGH